MSGGKAINDHSFWAGSKPKGTVFPESAKMKPMSDASGSGHEAYYEDTAQAIERVQDQGAAKAKSHKMKDGYRN